MHAGFCLGQTIVEPNLGVVIRDSERYHLPPKAMEILVLLASKDCNVVSRDEILEFGWGDANASGSNVTHIISEIRHALDDHIECPIYIQTIPRKGYRMMLPTIEKTESGIFSLGSNTSSENLTSSIWHISMAIFKSSRLLKPSAAYIVISWVLLQVFALVSPIFHAPEWAVKIATLLVIIGFPIFFGFHWLQELKIRRRIILSKENKKKY
ncbi:winged helix-turn-helix domain-containing protein [Thalassotalea crassostreae]|nr:winged helix-turn-helix domain-containing protein [Thalassotalea crassostreae]